MKTIKELQGLIIDWAKEKNLNDPDKQYLKILEEVGETARAILKNDIPEIKDGIGDIAVTVIIYYWQQGYEIKLNFVYDNDSMNSSHSLQDVLWCVRELDMDVFESLKDVADHNGTTLKECLNLAWNEIKDRKGKTVNGTFVKNEIMENPIKPDHYKTNEDFDVIDVCKAYNLNFNRGNVIKYICRAVNKENELQDLKKALEYLVREIEYLEQNK